MENHDAILYFESALEECAGCLPFRHGPDKEHMEDWMSALRLAISALRTQKAPLDRNMWHCVHCNDVAFRDLMVRHGDRFCVNCGCPLSEEAWAELERRVRGNNG